MELNAQGLTRRGPILIVDDEASIRRTLEGIFRDEGMETVSVEDGTQAIDLISRIDPSVVLLDIWMPGRDGLEVLQEIKRLSPQLPVIMISGHATIATAIKATRLGAADFVEKPLDLHATLLAVQKALNASAGVNVTFREPADRADQSLFPKDAQPIIVQNIALRDQYWAGRKIIQRTLAQTGLLYGQGLHSGKKSGLILEPLPPNSGIHFVGISERETVPAYIDFVGGTGFATTLRLGQAQAGTTEHLLAALHASGISNLLIKCNGEVPVMDGSAREFCALFEAIGLVEQEGDWFEIEVRKKIEVGHGEERLTLEPSDCFEVDYTLRYPEPVGLQEYVFHLTSVESFQKEIAPARTFGFVKDVRALQSRGLALGGRFDNFVLIGEDGAINGEMRFPNEPVRHKILDVIGDLYLLGRPVRGKVTARMTGHSDNIEMVRALKQAMLEA